MIGEYKGREKGSITYPQTAITWWTTITRQLPTMAVWTIIKILNRFSSKVSADDVEIKIHNAIWVGLSFDAESLAQFFLQRLLLQLLLAIFILSWKFHRTVPYLKKDWARFWSKITFQSYFSAKLTNETADWLSTIKFFFRPWNKPMIASDSYLEDVLELCNIGLKNHFLSISHKIPFWL